MSSLVTHRATPSSQLPSSSLTIRSWIIYRRATGLLTMLTTDSLATFNTRDFLDFAEYDGLVLMS